MKYGDALAQRSVPEWLPYNLDYNELKETIKANTVDSRNGTNHAFEDELFHRLVDQYERINMFVKSKSGEIDRRLVACSRQVDTIRKRGNMALSRRRLERIERAEEDIQKVSIDIRNLSRFVGVQHTGFKKILKKYKKWSGSRSLSAQFLPVLEAPQSFTRRNFEPLLLQVAMMHNTVREPLMEKPQPPNLTSPGGDAPLRQIHARALLNNTKSGSNSISGIATDAEIDIALAANHLSSGGKAVYWVHNDHVVEVQLIVLKYLSLKTVGSGNASPMTASPDVSRRSSYVDITTGMGKDDDVSTIVFDDLTRFANAQSSATIAETSTQETGPQAQIYWCRTEKDTDAAMALHSEGQPATAKPITFRRKYIQDVVNASATDDTDEVKILAKGDENKESLRKVCKWMSDHRAVKPLVQILSRRSRFMESSFNGGTWAVMDREIRYAVPEATGDVLSELKNAASFPHAVLEIRWEDDVPGLVEELDRSHVVERVRGFSLDVHAVAVLYKPPTLRAPFWFSALEKDIRKTPDTNTKMFLRNARRVNSYGPTSSLSSKNQSNTSGTLAANSDALESSATAVTEASVTTVAARKKTRFAKDVFKQAAPQERYWNEFDDEVEDEPYTVLVQPDDRDNWTYFTDKVSSSLSSLRNWMVSRNENPETQPLFTSFSEDERALEEGQARRLFGAHNGRQYNTISVPKEGTDHDKSKRITQLYTLCLALAVLIMGFVGMLCFTSTSLSIGGDVGLFISVIIALVLAVIAISLFLVNPERAGLLHKSVVLFIFGLVCISAGVVLAIIGAGLGVGRT